jgi:hypothetical protein
MTDQDFYDRIQTTIDLLRPELDKIYPAGYAELRRNAAHKLDSLQRELDYRVSSARLGANHQTE